MAEFSPNEMNPLATWGKLIENTLNGNSPVGTPPSPTVSKGAQSNQKDPWSNLIDQLWKANPYFKMLPFDPAEVTEVFQQIWVNAISNPGKAWSNYNDFVQQYTQIMASTALKFWGAEQEVDPIIKPDKSDKRFDAPDWQQNAIFDALKQSYLLAATTMLKTASDTEGLDEKQQRKLVFYLRQFLDAISPSNFTFTNPQVIHESIKSGGQNLVKGMQNLMRDIQAGQVKMTDTDAFQPGRNLALTPGKVVHRNKLIELIQYKPATEKVYSVPLLFIPPWINKFYILDMQPHNSLIKYMVDQGFTVFVVSWKNPDPSLEETGFEDYMSLGLLESIDVIKEITASPKVLPIGYCIGGTLLSMTLPYLASKGDKSVDNAVFFVTLQDFSDVGDTSVFIDEPSIEYIEGQMLDRGYLDSRTMASMFNMLRANDLIWSNVVNNYLLGKEPPAFDLLYWNADGTRMTKAAHSFYLRNTYLENNLVKPNKIVLKNVPINLGKINQDLYVVGAEQDHIVPWQSAWRISKLAKGKVRFILGGSGHIAGVINPPSKGKGYWVNEKLANNAKDWLESAERHTGSWWPDWINWLKERTGNQVTPPKVGSKAHPALMDSPGSYVLEK